MSVSITRQLIRVARQVLENVQNRIAQQERLIEDVIDDIVRTLVPNLRQAWIGTDADRFIEEDVQGRLVPELNALMQAIAGINVSIRSAVEIIEQADNEAASAVSDLAQTFRSIY